MTRARLIFSASVVGPQQALLRPGAMFATGTRNCASRLIEVGAILKAKLLAGAAIAALIAAGPALAADLPLKAPPPVVAAWNWSGFYIGGHGGYGWGRNSQTDVNDPFFTGKF